MIGWRRIWGRTQVEKQLRVNEEKQLFVSVAFFQFCDFAVVTANSNQRNKIGNSQKITCFLLSTLRDATLVSEVKDQTLAIELKRVVAVWGLQLRPLQRPGHVREVDGEGVGGQSSSVMPGLPG